MLKIKKGKEGRKEVARKIYFSCRTCANGLIVNKQGLGMSGTAEVTLENIG